MLGRLTRMISTRQEVGTTCQSAASKQLLKAVLIGSESASESPEFTTAAMAARCGLTLLTIRFNLNPRDWVCEGSFYAGHEARHSLGKSAGNRSRTMIRAKSEWVIRKRDGRVSPYDDGLIGRAIANAFRAEQNLADG